MSDYTRIRIDIEKGQPRRFPAWVPWLGIVLTALGTIGTWGAVAGWW